MIYINNIMHAISQRILLIIPFYLSSEYPMITVYFVFLLFNPFAKTRYPTAVPTNLPIYLPTYLTVYLPTNLTTYGGPRRT